VSIRLRWLVAALIVIVAGVVALWPRSQEIGPSRSAPPAPDLVALRARAALPPCPPASGRVPAFDGIAVGCLGDGRETGLSDVVGSGPVLVNVWATWCQPCWEELPVLSRYAGEPGAVRVVTIATQSEPAGALELLADLGVRLPSVVDANRAVEKALNVPALPASYLVDERGEVRLIGQPRVFRSVEDVRAAVMRGGAR
jgi:thiol-disulfide isomerase/thioredoxin